MRVRKAAGPAEYRGCSEIGSFAPGEIAAATA